MPTASIAIAFASLIIGGAAAATTIVGVVNSQMGPPSQSPVSVTDPDIDGSSYGSTQ